MENEHKWKRSQIISNDLPLNVAEAEIESVVAGARTPQDELVAAFSVKFLVVRILIMEHFKGDLGHTRYLQSKKCC